MLDGYDTRPDVARRKLQELNASAAVSFCESSLALFLLRDFPQGFCFFLSRRFASSKRLRSAIRTVGPRIWAASGPGGHCLNPKSPPRGGGILTGAARPLAPVRARASCVSWPGRPDRSRITVLGVIPELPTYMSSRLSCMPVWYPREIHRQLGAVNRLDPSAISPNFETCPRSVDYVNRMSF
jgi:hypothetical protein